MQERADGKILIRSYPYVVETGAIDVHKMALLQPSSSVAVSN